MLWFQNLNIGKKIFIALTITMLLLAAVGIIGILGTRTINVRLNETLTVRLPALDYLIESDRDLQQLLVAERSMIFSDTGSEVFKKLVADYDENLKQAHDRIAKYEDLPLTKEEKLIIAEYKKRRAEWGKLSSQIVQGRKDDTREGRRLAIDLSLNQAQKAFEAMRTNLDKLQNINLKFIEEDRTVAISTYQKTLFTILGLTVIAILIVFLLLVLMNKTTTRPIREMVERAKELSEGQADLSRRLYTVSKDELGVLADYFNKFIQRIHEIIDNVKDGSKKIIAATRQIASGSEDLTMRTNQLAESITETSTTLEEFTSILHQTKTNAEEAHRNIETFDKEIDSKRQLIRNVTSTMTEISESSNQINNIMNVINDISFQTNLLALNAAVEAARAGEAGRGFAVVASEVRNLAQKTAESAKSIKEIVSANVTSTQRGMGLVKETEAFFESIMVMLTDISAVIESIQSGSKEQSTGMEQINQAVIQLDEVSNRNAELVNDFAKAGKNMRDDAEHLQELMGQFITSESGAGKPVPSSTPVVSKSKKETKPVKTKSLPEAEPKTSKKTETKSDVDFFSEDEDGFQEF